MTPTGLRGSREPDLIWPIYSQTLAWDIAGLMGDEAKVGDDLARFLPVDSGDQAALRASGFTSTSRIRQAWPHGSPCTRRSPFPRRPYTAHPDPSIRARTSSATMNSSVTSPPTSPATCTRSTPSREPASTTRPRPRVRPGACAAGVRVQRPDPRAARVPPSGRCRRRRWRPDRSRRSGHAPSNRVAPGGLPRGDRLNQPSVPAGADDDWYARFVALPLAPDLDRSAEQTVFHHPIPVTLYMPSGSDDETARCSTISRTTS